jgi:hypothetical protein
MRQVASTPTSSALACRTGLSCACCPGKAMAFACERALGIRQPMGDARAGGLG